MTKDADGKKYALIAGGCFSVFLIIIILNKLFASSGYYMTGNDTLAIFVCISITGLAVSHYSKNRIVVIIAAGFRVLLSLNMMVWTYRLGKTIMFQTYWFYNGCVCDLLAFATLIVLQIMAMGGRTPRTCLLWYSAGAIMLLVCIVDWIMTFVDFGWDTYLLIDTLKSTLFRAIELTALIFSGLWCSKIASQEVAGTFLVDLNDTDYCATKQTVLQNATSHETIPHRELQKSFKSETENSHNSMSCESDDEIELSATVLHQPTIKFCRRCGSELSPGSSICHLCGTPIIREGQEK